MTISANEFKSVIGLDEVHVALVTLDDSTGYTAGTPEDFAPAIEASAEPTASQSTQYADNKPFDVFTSEGETKITLTTTNIPIATLAKYLGKSFDVASGRMFDNGGGATPPDAALSFRSMKSNGKYRYFQYLKGKFSVPKDEAMTTGEKKEPKPSQIIFTAISTVYKWNLGTVTDSVKRIVGDEDSTNFSATGWFSQVQVPSVVAPSALALSTSNPADGASGVAVTKAPALTFNNALNGTTGIALFTVAGAVVSGSAVLDATSKIATFTPAANLTSGSAGYLMTYAVQDIYAQVLKGAIDFTTL